LTHSLCQRRSQLVLLQLLASFFNHLSILPSGVSVHPSGCAWETVGLERCDCYNFPPPRLHHISSLRPPALFSYSRFFHRGVSRIHRLDCHGNLMLGDSHNTISCLLNVCSCLHGEGNVLVTKVQRQSGHTCMLEMDPKAL